jgi:serine/threonine-protein kinase
MANTVSGRPGADGRLASAPGPGAGAAHAGDDDGPRLRRGTHQTRVCPMCGRVFIEELRYCPDDGTGLREAPDETAAPPHADPYAGKLLAGRYQCKRMVGEGGMGVVYEAEHVGIGRAVALKILRSNFVERGDLVARFQREARSASMIGHENIVEVIDSGTLEDGGIYIAMEFLSGWDLADVIAQEAPLSIARAVPIIEQTCRALGAAHDKGIVHRDLKPENVFLAKKKRPDGTVQETVKLLDFGIAKFTGADNSAGNRLTQTGSVFGTPEYMAPEQAAGKQVDGRADQYALGVILYEIFTADVPFHAETFMGVLSKHMFEAPLPPRSFRPEVSIPVGLENVILKMMEKDPAQRYPDMRACLDGIHAAVAGAAGVGPDGGLLRPGAPGAGGAAPGEAARAAAARAAAAETAAARAAEPRAALLDEPAPRRRGWLTIVLVAILALGGLGLLWLGFGSGAGGRGKPARPKKSDLSQPAAPPAPAPAALAAAAAPPP